MMWFIKAKRAMNDQDYESWYEGGVVPTLNAFDNGDTRTTTIIFYGNRVEDIRIQGAVINTLQARMGTGGNNMPMVAFSHTQGLSAQPSEEVWPTLRKEGAGMAVAYPIDDGRELEKKQNGTGIGDAESPMYTLDRVSHASVAFYSTDGGGNVPMVFEPKSAFEENWAESEVKNALRANASKSSHAVVKQSVVRRLTPMECERLQGFPDNWTEGQSDSARYKQMGNAVAVPCVEWVMERLVNDYQTRTR